MLMGAFIPGLRRKYPVHEYISALLLVIGLILFTLADAQTSPNFSIIGVLMISGALIMDSLMGNLQEAIFTMNPDTTQVMTPPPPPTIHEHKIVLAKKCASSGLSFYVLDRSRCCSARQLLDCLSCFHQ
jgi:hypothetical protein